MPARRSAAVLAAFLFQSSSGSFEAMATMFFAAGMFGSQEAATMASRRTRPFSSLAAFSSKAT
jgi:hypothetical protein